MFYVVNRGVELVRETCTSVRFRRKLGLALKKIEFIIGNRIKIKGIPYQEIYSLSYTVSAH